MWRKSLGEKCNILELGDNRLLGIEITCKDDVKICFVNIYMPYDCSENEDEFLQYLSKLNELFETYPSPYLYTMVILMLMFSEVVVVCLILVLI